MQSQAQGRAGVCCHTRPPHGRLSPGVGSHGTRSQAKAAQTFKQQRQDHQQSCSKQVAGSSRKRSVAVGAAAEQLTETEFDEEPAPQASAWQLDFSSRPILDERGKKKWELLICDAERTFQHAQYFPNNKINSKELASAIRQVLAREGAVKPDRCRYFRSQMATIIGRAMTELGIEPIPSRRCFALLAWLEERIESEYKQQPGYQEGQSSLFTLDPGAPEDLPDNLRGERWGFVQLPLSDLQSELDLLERGNMFGASIPLEATSCADLSPDTLIPGVVVFARRGDAIAGWLNGYEVSNLVADADRAGLILETGVNNRWRHGRYARSDETTGEAVAWEKAKKDARGLHFLVIQKDEEADLSGIWLLQDKPLPSI